MPSPADLLRKIEDAISCVLQDGGLNAQQLTFVHHIQKMAAELSAAVSPVPQTEKALRRIIPGFGDSFLQQQVALFGYARLLLEQPDSFDGAILSEYQQDEMRRIYQHGQTLHQLTEQLVAEAQSERRKQHGARPESLDLREFFAEELPILRYALRDVSVDLSIDVQSMIVMASPYHLAALLQHIVSTVAHELIESGEIKISTPQHAIIHIFCTGIQLNSSEQEILFQKNGHYLYPRRFQKDGGTIRFLREPSGATIQLVLSSFKP